MSKGTSIHQDSIVVASSKMLASSIDLNESFTGTYTGRWFTDHSTGNKKCRRYDNTKRQMMWENGNGCKQIRQFGVTFFPLWSNRASLAVLLAKVLHLFFFIILCNPLIHLLLQIIQTIYNLKFTVTTSEEESIINFASFVVVVVQFLTIKWQENLQRKLVLFSSPLLAGSLLGFFNYCFYFLFNLWPFFFVFQLNWSTQILPKAQMVLTLLQALLLVS